MPDRCLVEFRRTSGNCFKFQEVYKVLSSALADLVWDAKSDDVLAGRESGEELISDEAMMI